MDRAYPPINNLLEQAALITRRNKEATGAIEPTESYKRRQINTEDEIATYMQALGFEMDYYDEYHNEGYEVFDTVSNNVLYGRDGDLYFIDTQIRLRP